MLVWRFFQYLQTIDFRTQGETFSLFSEYLTHGYKIDPCAGNGEVRPSSAGRQYICPSILCLHVLMLTVLSQECLPCAQG